MQINRIAILSLLSAVTTAYDYLTATALVTNAQNLSALECWRFTEPLVESTTPGTSNSLTFTFNGSEAEYTILPPRYDGGTHNAPAAQIVAFTSGLAHLKLPYPVIGNSSDEAWFLGGSQGLLIATDTVGEGHITEYPSDQPTTVLSIPFPNGEVPDHTVLSSGPCHFTV